MQVVSLFDAKTHLSRIVEDLTSGKEKEVVISRHGKPMVRVVPVVGHDVSRRIGSAKGLFTVPDTIDAANSEIALLFAAEGKVTYAPSA